MSFQLDRILLLGKNGRTRQLRFHRGRLNIITGASATGKSSILSIVDYCLASSDYPVAAGVIRDTVAAYSLVLNTPNGQVLVARWAPEPGRRTNSRMYLGVGSFGDEPPDLPSLVPNADTDAAKDMLSELVGISENEFVPDQGTRIPLTATIRHSLAFALQAQNEIANPSVLFHGQGEEWRPQAIRDTLPYFVGAVDGDEIRKRGVLRALRRDLKAIDRASGDTDQIQAVSGRIRALLAEAAQVGLIDVAEVGQIESRDGALRTLARLAETLDSPPMDLPDHDRYAELLDQRSGLRLQLSRARSELRALAQLSNEQTRYLAEASEQEARLAALDLLPLSEDAHNEICPLCSTHLDDPIPAVAHLRASLNKLAGEVGAARRGTPGLQRAARAA